MGKAISELLRRAEQAPPIANASLLTRNRHGRLVKRKVPGKVVTPAMVKKYAEDDPLKPFAYRASLRFFSRMKS
jgi:hypothetical protein